MTYELPASYDPDDNRIVALPQAIIPIVAGRLHTLEYESSWESNKAAGVQAALLVQERLITPYTASGYDLPANYAATDNRLVAIPKALIPIINQRLLDLIAPAAWIAEDATAGPEAISLLQDRLVPATLMLTTIHTGTFVGIIQKTGLPLVWDTGDGEIFTGNNPNWIYETEDIRVVRATCDDGLQGITAITLANVHLTEFIISSSGYNLRILNLSTNQISDISPLADLTNLQTLYLPSNQISDISPLADLTNLQVLYLHYNQISDISPLADLTNLQVLYLHYNQISDISPLADLTNLTHLQLRDNRIIDISPLAAMTKLRILYCYNNKISDITPVWNNRAALGAIACAIDLRFNRLSSLALSQVNDLRAAGCTVTV